MADTLDRCVETGLGLVDRVENGTLRALHGKFTQAVASGDSSSAGLDALVSTAPSECMISHTSHPERRTLSSRSARGDQAA